jgi:Uncharacterised protein family (UPF0175)
VVITVEIPDSIARQLDLDGPDGSRRALEMFALEGYRSAALSRGQVSELLGQSFFETEAFLKEHDCPAGLTVEQHERGLAALKRRLAQEMP